MKQLLLAFFSLLLNIILAAQAPLSLVSPDGKLRSDIHIGKQITYDLKIGDHLLMDKSPVSLHISTGEVWGSNARLIKKENTSFNGTIQPAFYKKAEIKDQYNQLRLTFKGGWGLIFRMYNDGMAYRFFSNRTGDYQIMNEEVQLNLPEDYETLAAYANTGKKDFEEQFHNSFENTYEHKKASQLDKDRLIFLPLLFDAGNNVKVCFTEVDLLNYPGLYLNPAGGGSLKGVLAPYPKNEQQGGHNMLQMRVTAREAYIAKVSGQRDFPWRAFIVSTSDKDLLNSDMTYKLAAPSKIKNTSFVKPGKVAWDWWNNWNIRKVDFEAGVNNKTYEYYIDFASKNNIEYVILDEGWAVNKKADLMQVVSEIDVKHLVDYAKQRNVGIILWAGYYAFDRDMEKVCSYYAEMGVKGFKVDFMDRDDQKMVQFIQRASETAARYGLMLDLHGMYKPAGLNRTYPNVINFEGVFGLEQLKWSNEKVDMVTNDLTIPFIRMIAGPLDYTPGAMLNAAKGNYAPVHNKPMSQGTRCRQLALFVVFESPLEMLCDSPSEYIREKESTEFLTHIPTVWDETIALEGKVQEYLSIARRKGTDWYIAGLTNWDKRKMKVELGFLEDGASYKATIFRDGVNAHRDGTDYIKEEKTVKKSDTISLDVQPGGGYIMRLQKI